MPRLVRSLSDRKKASREKTRAYRERMRRQGLRPVQIWVPDINAPGFADEIRREGEIISRAVSSEDDQAFVDAITIDW